MTHSDPGSIGAYHWIAALSVAAVLHLYGLFVLHEPRSDIPSMDSGFDEIVVLLSGDRRETAAPVTAPDGLEELDPNQIAPVETVSDYLEAQALQPQLQEPTVVPEEGAETVNNPAPATSVAAPESPTVRSTVQAGPVQNETTTTESPREAVIEPVVEPRAQDETASEETVLEVVTAYTADTAAPDVAAETDEPPPQPAVASEAVAVDDPQAVLNVTSPQPPNTTSTEVSETVVGDSVLAMETVPLEDALVERQTRLEEPVADTEPAVSPVDQAPAPTVEAAVEVESPPQPSDAGVVIPAPDVEVPVEQNVPAAIAQEETLIQAEDAEAPVVEESVPEVLDAEPGVSVASVVEEPPVAESETAELEAVPVAEPVAEVEATPVQTVPQNQVLTPPEGAMLVSRAVTLEELLERSRGDRGVSASYVGQLIGWLRSNSHYPRAARLAGQEGKTVVTFAIDRDGKVSDLILETPSGYALLDREAIEMIERSDPFPAMPPDMAGDKLELRVPVVFDIEDDGLDRTLPPINLW